MDIVDTNQPQTDSSIMINKSWKHPTAAKQEIIQRDEAGNNRQMAACTSAWNNLLSAVKLVLKWLYIGIAWHLLAGKLLHRILLVRQTA